MTFVGPTVTELFQILKTTQGNQHYMYEYSHRPSRSHMPDWLSATHGDELESVFNVSLKVLFITCIYRPM